MFGHSDIVKMLLQYGGDSTCLHQPNSSGFYPLHLAALELHVECATILLKHGALITQPTAERLKTLFYLAASTLAERRKWQANSMEEEMIQLKKRTHEMLDLLIANLPPDTEFSVTDDRVLSSVFHCFAAVDYAEGIKRLAAAPYYHPPDLESKDGKTPLWYAIMSQSHAAILQLLDLDVEIQNQVQLISKKWLIPDDEAVKVYLSRVIAKLVDKGK
jgi:ankyrin repeat protein